MVRNRSAYTSLPGNADSSMELAIPDINFIQPPCYFVRGLFNDAVSSLNYKTSNDRMMNELKSIWKEAVVAQFKVLSQHLLEGAEETHE
jgi:hypothetical protein